MSEKTRLAVFLLCSMFGWLGAHRFYVGKKVSGVVWLLTLGLLFIGWSVDLILITAGTFRDKSGKKVGAWVVVRDKEGKEIEYWT
ncbi:MAG: TM2 domain-containing protein [Chloroflexi bacterium]|nr:TM2 domain-containing protein [Chloroflexota bacterium]